MNNMLLENFNRELEFRYPENEGFKNFITLIRLVTKEIPLDKLELYKNITSESLFKEETLNILFKSICLLNSLAKLYLKEETSRVVSTDDKYSEENSAKNIEILVINRFFNVEYNLTLEITDVTSKGYYSSYRRDIINNILDIINDRFAPSESFENKLYIITNYLFYYLILAYSCYLYLDKMSKFEYQVEFLTFLNNSF